MHLFLNILRKENLLSGCLKMLKQLIAHRVNSWCQRHLHDQTSNPGNDFGCCNFLYGKNTPHFFSYKLREKCVLIYSCLDMVEGQLHKMMLHATQPRKCKHSKELNFLASKFLAFLQPRPEPARIHHVSHFGTGHQQVFPPNINTLNTVIKEEWAKCPWTSWLRFAKYSRLCWYYNER